MKTLLGHAHDSIVSYLSSFIGKGFTDQSKARKRGCLTLSSAVCLGLSNSAAAAFKQVWTASGREWEMLRNTSSARGLSSSNMVRASNKEAPVNLRNNTALNCLSARSLQALLKRYFGDGNNRGATPARSKPSVQPQIRAGERRFQPTPFASMY